MGYLLFCGYYFFRPFRAPPAVLCESGYLLERFLRAKGELRKRKDVAGEGLRIYRHMSSYVSICLCLSQYGQSVNNALEQAYFKNVAKFMLLGKKRTGFS